MAVAAGFWSARRSGDPAALARDTAYLAEAGYSLRSLRGLDLFPMTHHIECVAVFERG